MEIRMNAFFVNLHLTLINQCGEKRRTSFGQIQFLFSFILSEFDTSENSFVESLNLFFPISPH